MRGLNIVRNISLKLSDIGRKRSYYRIHRFRELCVLFFFRNEWEKIVFSFIIRGRGRFKRQLSELNSTALPKPPVEFFEPLELPGIPQNLKPEMFYILQHFKYESFYITYFSYSYLFIIL